MKKIAIYPLLLALLTLGSCALFELDNYDAPEETLRGTVVDAATGNPVFTDQGSEGIRVRLWELSYHDQEHLNHNPDFWCKPDGTFQNTKLFPGTYKVELDGPFIPLIRKDPDGLLLADETKTVEVKGVADMRYEVQPFLKVEFVGTPQVRNGRVEARVRVTRAVSVEEFRAKVEPTVRRYRNNFTNVTDVQLFVSYSSTVGYRARDERWSNSILYEDSNFSTLLGQAIDIRSQGVIPSGRTVFVRAAARINYETVGHRRYNYSEAVEVIVP